MAMANTAWILASNGNRVLMIDWDLEAPGLHKYFHPFLQDKTLNNTRGLMDFILDFASAAMAKQTEEKAASSRDWFFPYANVLRYADSLQWDAFPKRGTIDLVAAGKQDVHYATRVNSFDWQGFYGKLGGGVFLEAVKDRAKSEYDYVLIDSRTGVSDTSGICTVQMPDDLVICFTYNSQSIDGATAAAESVYLQRQRPNGESAIRLWPVPMRVELAEKDKLEAARDEARRRFTPFLGHLALRDQTRYWERIEVLYQPYYAYEEILAVFGDRPGQTNSLLSSMEVLTEYLTDGKVDRAVSPDRREEITRLFTRVSSDPSTRADQSRRERSQEVLHQPTSQREEIVLARLEDQARWYSVKSRRSQRIYKYLKAISLVSLAAIPILMVVPDLVHLRLVAAFLAILALIIEGLQQLNQYQQIWTTYRATSEALTHEKYLFLAQAGPYAGTANSVALLAERMESIMSQENAKWVSMQRQSVKS